MQRRSEKRSSWYDRLVDLVRNSVSAGSDPHSIESVRLQLARILASSSFDGTDRQRAFLGHVVAESLAGRADRISAYSIAVDVFGRTASFDSHADSIVRVEARQLRRALEHYYLTAGKKDPLVIEIPKGTYAPAFRDPAAGARRSSHGRPGRSLAWAGTAVILLGVVIALRLLSGPSTRATPSEPDLPRLLVVPFASLATDSSLQPIADGLLHEITNEISRFKDIIVVDASQQGAGTPRGRYDLNGAVTVAENRIRVQAQVRDASNGSVVWADSFSSDFDASRVLDIESEIARKVATALGQPRGPIFAADAARSIPDAPDDWTAYACTLSYYAYHASLDGRTHSDVRSCLEKAVGRFPTYATAWALLSQTYVDELRFGYAPAASSPPASIELALAAARTAVALDPGNVRALQAEMLARYMRGERQEALEIGRKAAILNPNDTEITGEYGFRLALSGKWAQGCELVSQARDETLGHVDYLETALALCAYFLDDPSLALRRIKASPISHNVVYHVAAAAILAEAGLLTEAEGERAWLLANTPWLCSNLRNEVEARFARAQDSERMLRSLAKAGLPSVQQAVMP